MITIGIDPGITGGIAILDGMKLCRTKRMPTSLLGGKKIINANEVSTFCLSQNPDLFVIEKGIPMPGQSSVATFSSGLNMGILAAISQLAQVPTLWVHPRTWKSFFRIGSNKRESLNFASQSFGDDGIHKWSVMANNGIAEAALIALWAVQKGKGI